MADSTHLARLLEGVAAWNEWREANPGIIPDLTGVDLTEDDLRSTSLYKRDVNGHLKINLQHANLHRANLQGAKLWRANLRGASLWEANLQGASLWEANLQGAVLSGANLQDADLQGANFQDA